ncbi:hypothetical protein [Bradyrhizobium australiense]|uniref:Uncharacterized protein n=1 Tax=Bradyrhizobium australiense TaxID=2721161 RepID=A0A7Y4LUJ7_9BRAD|nr:hypothetical protein [Bradyrhizobium australiense]NOJ39074.1 hypothetical protein [Bradyrhizobium australiense]
MTFKPQPELLEAVLGEETKVSLPTNKAAVFVSFHHRHAADVARLVSALTEDKRLRQKHFWSIFDHSDIKPASLLLPEQAKVREAGRAAGRPFWQKHAQIDETYISRKQIDAIRDEVADVWKSILPDPAILAGNHDVPEYILPEPDPELLFRLCHEIAHVHLSETDVQRIELAVKQAIEKRARRIQRFVFRRTRAYLRGYDAVRVAIHCYRVRTGISPPGTEPNWTACSSKSASIPFSEEKYHEHVRRRANRRRFPRPAPDGCARKRRTPSRQANRHPARSRKAGGLSNRRTGTHCEAPQHRATHLLLQHRGPVVDYVPMAA